MRVVKEIPGEKFNISIYSWNGKFLIKFEQGFFEQTYKVNELDLLPNVELPDVLKNEVFLMKVEQRFDEMASDFSNLMEDYI